MSFNIPLRAKIPIDVPTLHRLMCYHVPID